MGVNVASRVFTQPECIQLTVSVCVCVSVWLAMCVLSDTHNTFETEADRINELPPPSLHSFYCINCIHTKGWWCAFTQYSDKIFSNGFNCDRFNGKRYQKEFLFCCSGRRRTLLQVRKWQNPLPPPPALLSVFRGRVH